MEELFNQSPSILFLFLKKDSNKNKKFKPKTSIYIKIKLRYQSQKDDTTKRKGLPLKTFSAPSIIKGINKGPLINIGWRKAEYKTVRLKQ